MSDDTGDSNDLDLKPSGSRKRRIVMRIEFDDSNESDEDSYTTGTSTGEDGHDERPTTSNQALRRSNRRAQIKPKNTETRQESVASQNEIRNRRKRIIHMDATSSDDSSSGSEIGRRKITRRKKHVVLSEDDDQKDEKNLKNQLIPGGKQQNDDNGFSSDSSSNELLEKCPICLLTFRQQEIGTPSSCEHIFCANCIEAWSKNVHTCPIDRLEFDRIIVRASYANRSIVREIKIDPKKANKELILEDEEVIVDDDDNELTYCEICESPDREDVMLLCDLCNRGTHIYCLSPPLSEIPSGAWYCEHCFDPEDEDTDLEDLNALFDDIRDMGIPDARLRVTEVQQPRIMRTRQNERIRAAVLRRTRRTIAQERGNPSERARGRGPESSSRTSATNLRNTRRIGGENNSGDLGNTENRYLRDISTTTTTTTRTTTTTTRTTTTRTTKTKTRTGRKRRAPRRKRRRCRTYVVEYDINDFDEKFPLETTKKVVRRRRRKRRAVRRTKGEAATRSASKRLAEQLGVKKDVTHGSHFNDTAPSFSLFGNANDLDYFSDDNDADANDGMPREMQIGSGGVQTAVRLSNYGSHHLRSRLLAGKATVARPRPIINEPPPAAVDLLSNIIDMQDRWHNATRNLDRVHINADGTLNFEENQQRKTSLNINQDVIGTPSVQENVKGITPRALQPRKSSEGSQNSNHTITEAPMYPRGGGNPNFNSSGSGGGSSYNNRYNNNNNQGSFHGGSVGNNRHSTGNVSTGANSGGGISAYNSNMIGRGNYNFNNPNYNSNPNQNPNQNQDANSNFSPFNLRFNQRNQQRDNNQRSSLPFMNRIDNNTSMQQLQPPPQPAPIFNSPHPGMQIDNNLFSGIPPPVMCPAQPTDLGIFSSLPPPVVGPAAPVLSVPPPPAPPPGVQLPWNSSLFQLNTNYSGGDEDDDSNCPNFSVYSAESQEVAKSTTSLNKQPNSNVPLPKEDDGNEDLVQLDDDEEDIPLPPESNEHDNVKFAKGSDLYEPENPTEENDDDDNDDDNNDDDDMKKKDIESDKKDNKGAVKEKPEHKEDEDDEDDEEDEDENKDEHEDEDDPASRDRDEDENDTKDRKENTNSKVTQNGKERRERDKSSEKDDDDTSDRFNPEHETSSHINSNSNNENDTNDKMSSITTEEEEDHSKPTKKDDDEKDKEKIKQKPTKKLQQLRSLGPLKSKKTVEEHDGNPKGVLELYDEDDWEELNIERPKITIVLKSTKLKTKEMPVREEDSEDDEINEKEKEPELTRETENIAIQENIEPIEQDRSYTPCLDENNEPEDGETDSQEAGPEHGSEGEINVKSPIATARSPRSRERSSESHITAEKDRNIPNTELISEDDDENNRGRDKYRGGRRLKHDRENGETFKKVSTKRRERNYRSDRPSHKKHDGRSVSRRRDESRSRSHSRSRSRSKSRPMRSRSHSPRRRGRGRRSYSRSRSRSRSFNNNKENIGWRQGFQRSNNNGRRPFFRPYPPFRNKRREMPRYDVRNVVGNARNLNRDRYGRDSGRGGGGIRYSRSLSRGRQRGRSFSRSKTRSVSPNRRNRRASFSISPTPPHMKNNRRSGSSPRRYKSPSVRKRSNSPVRRPSPPQPAIRHRSHTPRQKEPSRSPSMSPSPVPSTHQMNGRTVMRHIVHGASSPEHIHQKSRSKTPSQPPLMSPRLSRSLSRSPPSHGKRGKKKKSRDRKKKKSKKRPVSASPEPMRRISRQRDPFKDSVDAQPPPKKKRRHTSKNKSPVAETAWSPSPSPPPPAVLSYEERAHNNDLSWTPPIASPLPPIREMSPGIYETRRSRSRSRSSRREKRKRNKKKKLSRVEKRAKEFRKEKRRLRRTETPEVLPSKEVFASGNNILVSVSFNKEAASQQQHQTHSQTTVVTVPPNREDVLSRRPSRERFVRSASLARRRKERALKRKKLDTKPVAIIDLERSPFQVHQEPADVIVLTDSEDTHGNDHHEHLREHDHHHSHLNESSGIEDDDDRHHINMNNSGRSVGSPNDKTPPMERLDTIMEESYEIQQTGPKTPPEPPTIKFNMPTKKQNKVRNPLHDEEEINSDLESQSHPDPEQYRAEIEAMHNQTTQKIGPNTPPESGPCSPDVYDPCEPTKSPSISPRSPTPQPPLDVSQTSTIGESIDNEITNARPKHTNEEVAPPRISVERTSQQTMPPSNTAQTPALNAVELVMKLINSKPNTSQDISNKPNESPFSATSHAHNNTSIAPVIGATNLHDDNRAIQRNEKPNDENHKNITVLSNVLISTGSSQQSQHIPVISSPSPVVKTSIMKLPMPKVGGSVGSSSSGIAVPSTSVNLRNGSTAAPAIGGGGNAANNDESFNLDFDSPYSPGSADYEDLFEPPPDTSSGKKRSKSHATAGKGELFDNLFGTSSPIGGYLRLPSYTPSSRKSKANAQSSENLKNKVKAGNDAKMYDDMPTSAVDLQLKDRFLRKLNRQERVVEEVKHFLKPRFNKKQISKEDYKEIMRRAVPKICHSRSGEINPYKIKNLIDAYVKKFRAKHKKLNLINTGQSSAEFFSGDNECF